MESSILWGIDLLNIQDGSGPFIIRSGSGSVDPVLKYRSGSGSGWTKKTGSGSGWTKKLDPDPT